MPAHAQKRYRHIYIYIYTYIYTHRESLIRNHEPRAKALGNNIGLRGLNMCDYNYHYYGLRAITHEVKK